MSNHGQRDSRYASGEAVVVSSPRAYGGSFTLCIDDDLDAEARVGGGGGFAVEVDSSGSGSSDGLGILSSSLRSWWLC